MYTHRMDTEALLGREYLPRFIDTVLHNYLSISGAILLEGMRGCGKTMTGANAAASAIVLDDPSIQMRLTMDPSFALNGEHPRLLDEWQLHPAVWNGVRRAVDRSKSRGQFILTGSSVPADDVTRHTGAGRILRLRERTMTWSERGLRNSEDSDPIQKVSLTGLFKGERPSSGARGLSYSEMCDALCVGGLPDLIEDTPQAAQIRLRGYLDEVVHTDLNRLHRIRHQPRVLHGMLRSIARLTSTMGTFSTIAADLQQLAADITPQTVSVYCELLERLFVLENLPAWVPTLRSRARLRSSAKWHLADPSLAAAALGASSEKLAEDPNTAGYLFESQAIHDLRVVAQGLEGQVFHFRDSNENEIDAIIELPNGTWAAVEVKVSGTQVAAGEESLKKACAVIDSEPAFRLVLTAMGDTFTTIDGTVTCPLNALVP